MEISLWCCKVTWLVLPSLMSLCLLRNQSGILYWRGVYEKGNQVILTNSILSGSKFQSEYRTWDKIYLHNRDELLSVFLSELTSPLGEGDVGLLQHNVSVPGNDQTDDTKLNFIEYLRPIPLMEVSANMTLVFPSMLVLRTRKMCWKLGGTTNDMVLLTFYLKHALFLLF